MDSGNNNDVEREAKKLRSCDPDLKVVLGCDEIFAATIEYHHSQALASKSKYIDAMLSTPMKEREARTISFPDITRDTWQKMMKFLDCPAAAWKMTARDTLDVAVFYDKYEFGEGRELCDLVMVDYFKTTYAMEKSHTQ